MTAKEFEDLDARLDALMLGGMQTLELDWQTVLKETVTWGIEDPKIAWDLKMTWLLRLVRKFKGLGRHEEPQVTQMFAHGFARLKELAPVA